MGQGLGEVAAGLSGHRGFLGEQTQVVCVPEHALEHEPGFVEPGPVVPSRAGEGFDQPEGAVLKVPSSPVRPSGLASVL
jgi:hypothetical protein